MAERETTLPDIHGGLVNDIGPSIRAKPKFLEKGLDWALGFLHPEVPTETVSALGSALDDSDRAITERMEISVFMTNYTGQQLLEIQ
jgi:hypothetical protein